MDEDSDELLSFVCFTVVRTNTILTAGGRKVSSNLVVEDFPEKDNWTEIFQELFLKNYFQNWSEPVEVV